jgi:hypothetical protein
MFLEISMVFVRILIVLAVSLSALGCSVNAPPIVETAAVEVPDGKNTGSSGFSVGRPAHELAG